MKRYGDIAGDGGSAILAQVQEQRDRVGARLAYVKHVVAMASGKGGVGKSAMVANLAAAFVQRGRSVGVLDTDLNGPAMAKMLGVARQRLRVEDGYAAPAIGLLGIKLVSMALLLPHDEAPVIWDAPAQDGAYVWRGTMEASAVREFLADADWGALDYLLVDLPPGVDRLLHLTELLPGRIHAVFVTIPSRVSRMIVAKAVSLAQRSGIRVVGLVENMAGYLCPRCGALGDLFPDGHVESMAKAFGLPHLGKVPFDPRIAKCGDQGEPFLAEHPSTPAARAFRDAASSLEKFLEEDE